MKMRNRALGKWRKRFLFVVRCLQVKVTSIELTVQIFCCNLQSHHDQHGPQGELDKSGRDAIKSRHQRLSSWARLTIPFQPTLTIGWACQSTALLGGTQPETALVFLVEARGYGSYILSTGLAANSDGGGEHSRLSSKGVRRKLHVPAARGAEEGERRDGRDRQEVPEGGGEVRRVVSGEGRVGPIVAVQREAANKKGIFRFLTGVAQPRAK